MPGVWISHCVELDVVSQHTKAEVAVEACAEAVRMILQSEMQRCGISATEAFAKIAAEVVQRKHEAAPVMP